MCCEEEMTSPLIDCQIAQVKWAQPMPGGQLARQQGCLCPVQYAEDIRDQVMTVHEECPLHGAIVVFEVV